MLITKTVEIDMGHRVPNHKSKCRNLHGHRYKIEVGVDDKVIFKQGDSSEGMVIDFGDLKDIIMEQIDFRFDHGMVLWTGDEFAKHIFEAGLKLVVVDFIPTAENLAKYWYTLLDVVLKEKGIKINHVTVWETPTSTATFNKKDE